MQKFTNLTQQLSQTTQKYYLNNLLTKENSNLTYKNKNVVFKSPKPVKVRLLEAKSLLNKNIKKSKNGTGFKFSLRNFNSLTISSNSLVKKVKIQQQVVYKKQIENVKNQNQQKYNSQKITFPRAEDGILQARSDKNIQIVTRLVGKF